MIYHLEQTTSTNDDAREACYRHGDVIWAELQTAGRGQRGHVWHSPRGENLTFSAVLEPTFLPANEQFLLSEIVTLALTDVFAQYGVDTRIKWTNDIYAGDRKLVGMLIEHVLSGGRLVRTIAGIGINVNQTAFDPVLPNPVSLRQLTGRTFERREVLDAFLDALERRYVRLETGDCVGLQEEFRGRLYRLGERHLYRFPDGSTARAVIEGVRPTGALLLRHDDGLLREYLFREVEFVIEKRDSASPEAK